MLVKHFPPNLHKVQRYQTHLRLMMKSSQAEDDDSIPINRLHFGREERAE